VASRWRWWWPTAAGVGSETFSRRSNPRRQLQARPLDASASDHQVWLTPPDINKVETEDDYIHVRFRDPDRYDEIRTPEWAAQPARSVSEGSEVRTGKLEGEDEWEITSVLLDKHVGEETAKDQAREIVDKIES